MKHSLLILSILFWTIVTKGQHLQFDKIRLQSVDSIASISQSVKFQYDYTIGVDEFYFPNRMTYSLAQPLVYRKKINGGKLETSFYYSLPDSTVRLIEYWWDGNSKSKKFGRKTLKKNARKISRQFGNKGTHFPETDDKAEKTIWDSSTQSVQQFWVLGDDNYYFIRVLISWIDDGGG